ncbi:MAG: hypothetical protein KDJ38_09200 [Gammaproteobacteria bacterium]|nr:hypothetical protein [Gammaproteobacteria bacterium]
MLYAFSTTSRAYHPLLDEALPVTPTISTVSLFTDTVADTVDYAPNLPDGSLTEAKTRQRYLAYGVHLSTPISRQLQLFGGLANRRMVSKRDDLDLQSWWLGVAWNPDKPLWGHKLQYTASLGRNSSDAFEKNSYTDYAGQLIKQLSITRPQDLQLLQTLSYRISPAKPFALTLFGGLGYIKTSHQGVSGYSRSDEGCNYRFDVANDQGVIQQIDSCGPVLAFEQTYPDYDTIEEVLGFHPNEDLSYRAHHAQLGWLAQWHYGRWQSSLGYAYQFIDRGQLDRRIKRAGGRVVTDNHMLKWNSRYRFRPGLSLLLGIEYQRHQMLGTLPVLYSGVTTEKFVNDLAVFRLGLQFDFEGKQL